MKESNNLHTSAFDISFAIIGMKFKLTFEDGFFDKKEIDDITNFVNSMSKEMHVDSTYVEKATSKYKSTFMLDEGWNALCDLIKDSRYGMYLNPASQETLVDAFCIMGKCYIYECLALLYDFEHIYVEVDASKDFDVVILKEESGTWKRYPGKWQNWKNVF